MAITPYSEVVHATTDGWPFHRVISIEEDHLPHLLQGDPYSLLHPLNEEKEMEEARIDLQMSPMNFFNTPGTSLIRGKPIDKQTLRKVNYYCFMYLQM